MRPFVRAILVTLLVFSASGVSALVIAEPCASEQTAQDDGGCPPTCVTCGCCAQAAEPAALAVAVAPLDLVADFTPLIPRLPKTTPRDILHVPKTRVA